MSEYFEFQLEEADVLKVMTDYINRTLFKKPLTITSIVRAAEGARFEFVAIAATSKPRASKPRKTTKRGLARPVLAQANEIAEAPLPELVRSSE